MGLTKTDKATLAGLYIAKFDKDALGALGFSKMWEAFNVLGYSLGSSPASIKNYRDEFDRLFPDNPRRGWQRPLKTRSEKLFGEFGSLDIDGFTELIRGFFVEHLESEDVFEVGTQKNSNKNVVKRLMTGKAAEAYFREKYTMLSAFEGFELQDTTDFACGFDFRLSRATEHYCVEVKGLGSTSGNVMLTEKEYAVAAEQRANYCLFVVKNFSERQPCHQVFFDPLNSELAFRRYERMVKQVNYSTVVS